MRTYSALCAFFLVAMASGCSGSALSNADVTRLCELQVRCSGGFLTQESCETATRQSRDDAAAQGCAVYFGAAGRCAIRTDECGTSSMCADQSARLASCLERPVDSGHIVDVDSGGVVTPSMLRIGAGGALEVFHDGRWGPICDDGFGMEEADVACRQMGFSGASGFSTITGESADFWLDDVSCTGGEPFLDLCSHGDWGSHNCSASETQAVACF